MSKHTPGPWYAAELNADNFRHAVADAFGSGTVHVYSESISLIEEGPANARLIAAAPELLKALDRAHLLILELLNEGDFKQKVELDLGYIVETIAKAEGRE